MVLDLSMIQSSVDWSVVKRFTPALYQRYASAKIYEIDGFSSEQQYNSHWSSLAQSLVIASKARLGAGRATVHRPRNPLRPMLPL